MLAMVLQLKVVLTMVRLRKPRARSIEMLSLPSHAGGGAAEATWP
jgi:hypothetical protein